MITVTDILKYLGTEEAEVVRRDGEIIIVCPPIEFSERNMSAIISLLKEKYDSATWLYHTPYLYIAASNRNAIRFLQEYLSEEHKEEGYMYM